MNRFFKGTNEFKSFGVEITKEYFSPKTNIHNVGRCIEKQLNELKTNSCSSTRLLALKKVRDEIYWLHLDFYVLIFSSGFDINVLQKDDYLFHVKDTDFKIVKKTELNKYLENPSLRNRMVLQVGYSFLGQSPRKGQSTPANDEFISILLGRDFYPIEQLYKEGTDLNTFIEFNTTGFFVNATQAGISLYTKMCRSALIYGRAGLKNLEVFEMCRDLLLEEKREEYSSFFKEFHYFAWKFDLRPGQCRSFPLFH